MIDSAKTVNIIARSNGVGLDRDVDLVAAVLEDAGYKVTRSHCRAVSPLNAFLPHRKKRYTVNIFMERLFLRWFCEAEYNILIPNQERFPKRQLKYLKRVDTVFAKSRHAERIFSEYHEDVIYTGFNSEDLLDQSNERRPNSFLHLAGRSTLKGTESILNLWGKNPHWPELTLLQCKENAATALPANVNLISNYLSKSDLKKLMNEHQVHLCTSLSEGWGHYIAEALSCGACVVTTDAPPMNELVTAQRGVLVDVDKSEPRHLGRNFWVSEEDLERQISFLVEDGIDSLDSVMTTGREWFEENDALFKESLLNALVESLAAH